MVSAVPKENSFYCMKLISHLTEHNDPALERLVWFFLFQRNHFQRNHFQKESLQ